MFDFRRESQQSQPQPTPSPTPEQSHGDSIQSDRPHTVMRPRSFGIGPPMPRPEQRPQQQGAGGQQSDGELVMPPRSDIKEREKIFRFEYRYDDSDTIMRELEEFYPYVEMPELNDMPERFTRAFGGEWMTADDKRRRQFIEEQLEYLESRRFDKRRAAQQSLLYLLLGNFGEAVYPEMQLTYIFNNARLIRSLDGVASLVVALKDASRRYNAPSEEKPNSGLAPGANAANGYPVGSSGENAQELMDVLGMLYFLVEVCRTDETFGDELMATTPPLPLLLFQMIASLKDKLPNGYPVKKVLLLLWKTLLACLGGIKEVNSAKRFAREIAGLPTAENKFTKSSPLDITTWRKDTSVKYPTFAPPASSSSSVSNEKLAESINPIPARPNYHSTELPPSSPRNGFGGSMPLPGTPAPSPPPSPVVRQKKQQFQTDPTKPFLFPYSRVPNSSDPASLVPFAISEADKLYHQHAYVSLGTYQMWEVREECLREERGLGRKGLIGFEPSEFDEGDGDDEEMLRLEWKYEIEEMEHEGMGDSKAAAAARTKKMDARRLRRVETIYKNTLPIMHSCVVVLLKLLLATVTGPGTVAGAAGMPQDITSPSAENPPDEARPVPPLSREEIDINRHKEITSKAVSAIVILLLKWFKVSHVMKFHYLCQLLFDSNCLLLVLKMFGLSDVLLAVQANNEVPDWNLFRYCYLNCCHSANREPGTPPNLRSAPTASMTSTDATGTEVETFYEFSWRNFFSTINFLKILQKMTKHRHHRTWMLSQYKSSQILKRMLKVQQPMLQLQVLKLIKSQMPWCGRKWRQANMKVITAIYLNCRPELRDEWLAGTDQEAEGDESIPQEYALRSLIAFYNKRHYASQLLSSQPEPSHQRTDSSSAVMLEDPAIGAHRGSTTEDVFPPRRTSDAGATYNPDGMIDFWLHEYEDVLHEVFGAPDEDMDDFGLIVAGVGGLNIDGNGRGSVGSVGAAEMDGPAWRRLGELMRARNGVDEEEISDSESIVTVGELGEDARLPGSNAKLDAEAFEAQHTGENTWAAMSPKTLSLLPRSPAERRRSSSSSSSGGPSLRPVIPKNLDALIGDDPFEDIGVDEEEELGPMPIERSTVDERERKFGAVDEVEYAYGE